MNRLITRIFSDDDEFKSKLSDSIDEANESGVAKLVTPEGTYNLARIDDSELIAEDEDNGELTSISKNPNKDGDYQVQPIDDKSDSTEDEAESDDLIPSTSTESFSDDEDKGRGIMVKLDRKSGLSPLIEVTSNRAEFERYSPLFTKSKWVTSFQEGEEFLKTCGVEGYLSEKDFSMTLDDVKVSDKEGIIDPKKADGDRTEDTLKDTEVKVDEGILDKKKAGLKNFSSILANAIVKAFADNGIDVDNLTADDLPNDLTQSKDEDKSEDGTKEDKTDDVPVFKVVSVDKPEKEELDATAENKDTSEDGSDDDGDTMSKLITSNSDQSTEPEDDDEGETKTSTESFSEEKWSIVNTETGLAVKTGKKEDLEKLMKRPEYQKKLTSDKNSPLKFQLVPEHNYSDCEDIKDELNDDEYKEKAYSEDLSIKKLLTPLGDDVNNSEEDVDVTPKIDPNAVEDNKVFSDLGINPDNTGVEFLKVEF